MLEKSDALEDAGRSILLELLKYSTIRRIVNMYDNAEFKRLDTSVYKPLEKEYPSLSNHFNAVRKTRNKYDVVFGIRLNLSNLQDLVLVAYLKYNDVLNKAKSIYDLYLQFSLAQMQFYLNIASQIQKTAAEKNIRLEQVMESVWYIDEAKRAVFMARQNAQEYFGTSQRLDREMMELKVAFDKLNKKSNETLNEAMKALYISKSDYLTKELDRIFPQNDDLRIQITK